MIGKVIYLAAFSSLVYWGMNYLGRERGILLDQTSSYVHSHKLVNIRLGVQLREHDALTITPDVLGIKAEPGIEYRVSYAIFNSGPGEVRATAALVPSANGENLEAIEISPRNADIKIPSNEKLAVSFSFRLTGNARILFDTAKLDLAISGLKGVPMGKKTRSSASAN